MFKKRNVVINIRKERRRRRRRKEEERSAWETGVWREGVRRGE